MAFRVRIELKGELAKARTRILVIDQGEHLKQPVLDARRGDRRGER
jgi:hypothetical protein